MTNFILKFGKYKGQVFLSTPKSYQYWLLTQAWFKVPNNELKSPSISKNWDGHSRQGEAQEWAYFQFEKRMAEIQDCKAGICSCCEGSMYFGI
jgi:hypothetical protein